MEGVVAFPLRSCHARRGEAPPVANPSTSGCDEALQKPAGLETNAPRDGEKRSGEPALRHE